MNGIGNRIREIRLSRGLTQGQLADLTDLKRTAIGNYENGVREPKMDVLRKIADALHVDVYQIIQFDSVTMDDADDDDLWTLREAERRDPDRKALFKLSKYGRPEDIRQVNAIIDALKATNPDFYDGDDPA